MRPVQFPGGEIILLTIALLALHGCKRPEQNSPTGIEATIAKQAPEKSSLPAYLFSPPDIIVNTTADALGIELAPDYSYSEGVSPNDPGDIDTGPNDLMNYPVLESALTTPGKLFVKGYIDTPNPKTVTNEYFANPVPDPGGDPSGYGEGAVYLGSKRPNAQSKFTATLPGVAAATLNTATATDAAGNTSEFALNLAATGLPDK